MRDASHRDMLVYEENVLAHDTILKKNDCAKKANSVINLEFECDIKKMLGVVELWIVENASGNI